MISLSSVVSFNPNISTPPRRFRRKPPNIMQGGALRSLFPGPSACKTPLLPLTAAPFRQAPFQASLAEAFKSLGDIISDGVCPTAEAYSRAIELCASGRALAEGQQVHAHLLKSVPDANSSVYLNTKLAFMYGKCGCVHSAEKVFDEMPQRTCFTWNAIVGAYISNGDPAGCLISYSRMRDSGFYPDHCTFASVLKACGALKDLLLGAVVHGLVIKFGYSSVVFVVNSLVAMYAKCDNLDGARRLFDSLNEKEDIVTWNSIISGYSSSGRGLEALQIFRNLQKTGLEMNTYTTVAALQACEDSEFRKLGMEIHAFVLKSDTDIIDYVANALISMYFRCGKINEAVHVFGNLEQRDNVSYNCVLSGFLQNGLHVEALQLFRDLQELGHKPDLVSIVNAISACGRMGYLLLGKEAHAYAIRRGLDCDLRVSNTLVDLYAKCSDEKYMGLAFDSIPLKDKISWTTIIAGYAQSNVPRDAIALFREVQMHGMEVDELMIGSILLACTGLKSLNYVKEVHGFVLKKSIIDLVLHNMLVDSYGECSNIDYAARTFRLMRDKDAISWTSMISSFVQNGFPNEAFSVFLEMMDTDVDADSVTLVSILSAAAALAVLNKGKEIHGYLIRKCFTTEGPLASSLVDMYARCGKLQSSRGVFNSIKSKDIILWTSMINAYGMHGQGLAAVELFREMEKDKRCLPDGISFLSILYACSHSGLINEGKKFIEIMEDKYNLEPWPEHYACLVDLLGRANCLDEAYEFIQAMPSEPTAEVWCSFLGACQIHSNKRLGEIAASRLLDLLPESPGNYVLVSNLFASSGRWKDVEDLRTRMKGKGLRKNPGCSWIEVGTKVHSFIARDKSHPDSKRIYLKLDEVTGLLARQGDYVPETKFVLHNVEEEEKVQMIYGHSERLAIAYGLLETREGSPIRVTKNLRICGDCHTFCKLVSKFYSREVVVRDASRFHHFNEGICSCGDYW